MLISSQKDDKKDLLQKIYQLEHSNDKLKLENKNMTNESTMSKSSQNYDQDSQSKINMLEKDLELQTEKAKNSEVSTISLMEQYETI